MGELQRKFWCSPPLHGCMQLYDYKPCAEFLADVMLYEPLEDPESLPSHLPSPVQTLAWRAGDCFDIATLLTSFLIGNGYDAYCVSGTAPKWITTRDTTAQVCPFEEPKFPVAEAPGADVSAVAGGRLLRLMARFIPVPSLLALL